MAKEDGRSKATTNDVTSSSSSSYCDSETEDLQRMSLKPPPLMFEQRFLYKQLSMFETSRDLAWERRRRQILRQERRNKGIIVSDNGCLTDEDLYELKGCIELGFGFNEEEGQKLCNTLPALDLYFAVNRKLSPSPVSSPQCQGDSSTSSPQCQSDSSTSSPQCQGDSWTSSPSVGCRNAATGMENSPSSPCFENPRSEPDWKIYNPGDDPQQVKIKLRHWAQAVACSLMQKNKKKEKSKRKYS